MTTIMKEGRDQYDTRVRSEEDGGSCKICGLRTTDRDTEIAGVITT